MASYESFYTQAFAAEINQQTDFQFIRFQIIQGLSQMYVFQLNHGFKFHQHFSLHNKVCPSVTYRFFKVLIKNIL